MLITLEGIEGSGKTTQIEKIVDFLTVRGHGCVTTREPGGTAIGQGIRSILLDPANGQLVPEAELLLYVADRVQHIRTVIQPGLAAGKVVVCDRFFDATLAYQGYARGLDMDLMTRLHRLVCQDLTPDLTLLFDLEPRTGLTRAWRQVADGGRTDRETRFEKEALAFHERVRKGYLELARMAPERFRIIDAAQSPDAVARQIEAVLAPMLPDSKTGR